MKTLHAYHNKYIKSVYHNFNKNDVIITNEIGINNDVIITNEIGINLIRIYLKMNSTLELKDFTFITIKELLEGKIDNMRFDYVVGNPPYQDNKNSDAGSLYIDITKKALTLLKPNGIIDFITPTTIAQVKKTGFTLSGKKGLKLIDYSANNYFNVGIKICRWQIDKSYKGKVKVIELDGTSEQRNYTDMMIEKKDKFAFELFEKIKTNKDKLFVLDQSTGNNNKQNTKDNIFKYKIYVNILKNTIAYSKIKPKLYKKKKIVFGMGAAYKKENMFITIEDVGQYQCAIDIETCTEKQIKNIKKFLFNDICIKIVEKYRITYKTGINAILYSFPKIDIDKEYNEKDVQKLFNLTDKEVEWLKK